MSIAHGVSPGFFSVARDGTEMTQRGLPQISVPDAIKIERATAGSVQQVFEDVTHPVSPLRTHRDDGVTPLSIPGKPTTECGLAEGSGTARDRWKS